MKSSNVYHSVLLCLALSFAVSCQKSEEKTKELQTSINKSKAAEQASMMEYFKGEQDFQDIESLAIIYLTSEVTGISNHEENLASQNNFVKKSGFPADLISTYTWSKGRTWQQADEDYQAFVKQNENHPYLKVFKQRAALAILKDLALLAEGTPNDKVAFYVNELFEGGFVEINFWYYCLRRLKNVYEAAKLKDFAKKVLAQIDNSEGLKTEATVAKEYEQALEQNKLTNKLNDADKKFYELEVSIFAKDKAIRQKFKNQIVTQFIK